MQSKKKIITCRKLILKEEEGEIRTSYNLQTGRFFSCFFLFFIAFELFTFLTSLSSSTRTPGLRLGPQLRSLPAILARGLRIRPAHSPFPPTLNWLVDKSPTLSGGGGGGIGKSTMRRCRRFDKGGRPATGFLQAGARPADRSPKVQGYCSCQSVKLLVSRFSRAGA